LVLWLLAMSATGCVSLGGLGELRGGSVVLLMEDVEGGPHLGGSEASLGRSLALVPLRIYPGEEDPELQEALSEQSGRLDAARREAEVRRAPWLLVFNETHVRVETARGAHLLWRTRLPRGPRAEGRLAARLERLLGGGKTPLGAGETRLVSMMELRKLRRSAIESRWDEYSTLLEQLITAYPADPAVRSHAGLREYLRGNSEGEQLLVLAAAMAPDSESELLSLALAAENAGKVGLAVRVREALIDLYPERLDYIPALADGAAALGETGQALALCRGRDVPEERSAALTLPMGSAPHQFPTALPIADLRFCTGWYLFGREQWEFSALAYEEAGDIYSALGRWDELAESLNNGGAAMVRADRPLSGASALRKAVDIREEIGVRGPLAVSRYNLGRALSDAGQHTAAVDSYREAAADYDAAGRPLEAVDALVSTLDVLAKDGARKNFEDQGEAIVARLTAAPPSREQQELLGNAWFELGAGRYILKDNEGAVAAFLRSLRSWQQLEMRAEEGQTHYSLAGPHLAMYLFAEAYSDLVRALDAAVEISDSVSIIEISRQLDDVETLIREAGQSLPLLPEYLREMLSRVPKSPE
jgi:tetratricopeptide (TPR) repeat protein